MGKRRTIFVTSLLAIVGIGLAGLWFFIQSRRAECAYVPLIADDLLPNASLAPDPASPRQAAGWGYHTSSGVELQQPSRDKKGFDLDGDDRALQLIGIANYVQTPPIAVQPGQSYCFTGFALTDEAAKGATRAQLVFSWLDSTGKELTHSAGDWETVALWNPAAKGWSPLRAAFRAPPDTTQLRVQVHPAADNRLYLDAMHVRQGGRPTIDDQQSTTPSLVQIAPWPEGRSAAVSFSYDWETTMGGLIHSRSLSSDDPNNADDPHTRGLRMRAGVTETVQLLQSYNIRATYYATGYNFLTGNSQRQTFMGDPTFTWAKQGNGWKSDWSQRPWFSTDPYGTIQSNPDYYFGDLIALLQAAAQDVQSHTFSHLYAGYASAQEWRADLQGWHEVAAAAKVPMARSLAFPWSSSAGMSDDNWRELEAAGITSVTRTNWSQPAYQLADRNTWRCQPVPGHESILACPDFYLMAGRTTAPDARIAQLHAGGGRDQAIEQIDQAIAQQGMVDIWAHTEEATLPAQIADWQAVVRYAAEQRDAGKLWIAPLAEIADWQQAVAGIRIQNAAASSQQLDSPLQFSATNDSARDLRGLTLLLPFKPRQVTVDGQILNSGSSLLNSLVMDVHAGQTVEVQAWPA
jgi:hypothetical protein